VITLSENDAKEFTHAMKALGEFDKDLSARLRQGIKDEVTKIKKDMKAVVLLPSPASQAAAEKTKKGKTLAPLKSGRVRGSKKSIHGTQIRKSIASAVTIRIQTTRARDAKVGIFVDMTKFYALTNAAQAGNGRKLVNRAPMLYAYNKESWTANHGGTHHGRPYFGRTIRKHQDGLEAAVKHAINISINEVQKHLTTK